MSTFTGSFIATGKRGSKDSEVSLAQTDGPRSPLAMTWREEGVGDEERGGQVAEEKEKRGIKEWFKEMLRGNETDGNEAEAMVFQFQRMDA